MKKMIIFLTSLPLIVTIIAIQYLPDQIPLHYNSAGEIDRWGSKYECFVFPIIIIIVSLIANYIAKKIYHNSSINCDEKEKRKAMNNKQLMDLLFVVVLVIMNLDHYSTMYSSYIEATNNMINSYLDNDFWMLITMGIIIIMLGYIIPKTDRNSIVGIRNKWTLSSDLVWKKSNQFSGYVLLITGILIIIIDCFIKNARNIFFGIGALIISILICEIRSKYYYSVYKDS